MCPIVQVIVYPRSCSLHLHHVHGELVLCADCCWNLSGHLQVH